MKDLQIKLEEKSSKPLADTDLTTIVLSTRAASMGSQARNDGLEVAQGPGRSPTSPIHEVNHPARNETGLSHDSQESGATMQSIVDDHLVEPQLSVPHFYQENQGPSARTYRPHQQIR
jgi:hypothetical protein